jgi:hypothetical protein
MNLLLYSEARQALNRHRNQGQRDDSLRLWHEDLAPLPDAIFEELGYFGALDETIEQDPDEESDWLEWCAVPAPGREWAARPAVPSLYPG